MERTYRKQMQADDLRYFTVIHKQTDLYIGAETDLKHICSDYIMRQRKILEGYICLQPEFEASLIPIKPYEDAPEIAIRMAEASAQANVGPMAAVAGAFSQLLAEHINNRSGNFVIENGGDLYIKTNKNRTVSVYAGENKLKDKLKMIIRPEDSPVGICTSSGKFGHSFSFGKADAVTIVSQDAILADAVATAVCNRVRSAEDIPAALEYALSIKHISGALIVANDKMGVYGKREWTETLFAILLYNRNFKNAKKSNKNNKKSSFFHYYLNKDFTILNSVQKSYRFYRKTGGKTKNESHINY